ncbi:MAG TPA: DUF2232 domain-containing protein [Nitrospinota bacterium]|nr:DUF2232 domain-containing protein [Nitrospinota bacterium]
MNTVGKVNPAFDILFPAILTLFLFLFVLYVPIIGALISLFSPLPIIYTSLQNGQKIGFFTLAIVISVLIILIGIRHGLIFFVEYGIIAIVISESIRRDFSIEKTILFCVLFTLVSIPIILLIYLFIQGKNPFTFLIEQMENNIDSSLEIYKNYSMGKSKSSEELKESFERLKGMFIYTFPALIVVGSIISSLLNYIIARHLWIKYISKHASNNRPVTLWYLPDYYVWLFIIAGFMIFLPLDFSKRVGLNLLIIISLIYFFQGLAVTIFFFRKSKIPKFFQGIGYLLIFIQPLIAIIVTAIGLFDIWIDFRKVRKVSHHKSQTKL